MTTPPARTEVASAAKAADEASERLPRVLLVDDEPALLRIYGRTLEKGGYAVDVAPEGEVAAKLLASRRYDVIVTDISMPGLDGIQLLRTVRRRDADVPVILMTGAPTLETAVSAVEGGALRYLLKPFDGKKLLEVVGQAHVLHQLACLRREAVAHLGGMGKLVTGRAELEESFERALRTLWIAYQPIVSWRERRAVAFEALVRSHDERLPNPGALFEAADRLGRLRDLGRAIRARIAPSVMSAPAERVFVNVHPEELDDEALYDETSPLSLVATKVTLEITERSHLENVRDLEARLGRLRDLGFRICIDDLGAGNASLTSFTTLRPEVVKFDMGLVRGLASDPTRRRIVGSMHELFDKLGVEVVAEGIETPEDRDALVEIGCDRLQGYLFARPGPSFPAPVF